MSPQPGDSLKTSRRTYLSSDISSSWESGPIIEGCGLAFLIGAIGTAYVEAAKPTFPAMVPIEQYPAEQHNCLQLAANSELDRNLAEVASLFEVLKPLGAIVKCEYA